MKSKIIPLCVLSLSLVSCKAMKEAGEVPGKTLQMAETTNQLKAGTERVEQTSNDLRYISEQLKELSKAGIGSEMRDENFKRIEESETTSKKLLHATKYMESFDFQLWNMTTDHRILSSDLRKIYEQHGVLELSLTLPELLPENWSKLPLSALETDSKTRGYAAMAATLHKVNMFQEIFRPVMKVEHVTMLDIIVEGLKTEKLVNEGKVDIEELREHEPSKYEVLKSAGLLKHTLEIRYKFLPLVALGRISNITSGLGAKVKMLMRDWSPEFRDDVQHLSITGNDKHRDITKNLNAAQIYYAYEVLEYTNRTGAILKDLGIEAKLDKKVAKILKHMKLNFTDIAAEEDTETVTQAKMKYIQKFNSELQTILDQNQ